MRFAAAMLASPETTAEDDAINAELAVVTAERCDTTRDDILTTASHCRVFMDSHGSEFSREFLSRFVIVVDLLRRTPTPTMH